MPKAFLLMVVLAMLFTSGCSSEPSETTVKIEGLDRMTQALQNNAIIEMKPASIQLGEKNILYIPEGNTSNGNFSVKHKFYELVDGKLTQVDIAQPTSK